MVVLRVDVGARRGASEKCTELICGDGHEKGAIAWAWAGMVMGNPTWCVRAVEACVGS